MTNQNNREEMDELLRQLEDDYVTSLKENEKQTVDTFIESFFYDSWDYNEQNIDNIKKVFARYTAGTISKQSFKESFNRMVDNLHKKLKELDKDKDYPLLHSKHGASLIVSLVDGLIVQYFIGVYDIDQLKDMTPHLKNVLLHALKLDTGD